MHRGLSLSAAGDKDGSGARRGHQTLANTARAVINAAWDEQRGNETARCHPFELTQRLAPALAPL